MNHTQSFHLNHQIFPISPSRLTVPTDSSKIRAIIFKHPMLKSLSSIHSKQISIPLSQMIQPVPLRPLDFTPLTISTLDAARHRSIMLRIAQKAQENKMQNPYQLGKIRSLSIKRPKQVKPRVFDPKMNYKSECSRFFMNRFSLGKLNIDKKKTETSSSTKSIQTKKLSEPKQIKIPYLYSSDQEKKMFYEKLEKRYQYDGGAIPNSQKSKLYYDLIGEW